jgi:16S rRNA (guanine527-N7)-methyltransferase
VAKDKSDKPPASTSVSDVPVLVEEQVRKRYTTHFKDLNEEALQRLLKFQGELIKSNRSLGLVPAATLGNADVVHFGDCIAACRLLYPLLIKDKPVYDFASSNGLPGLVLAILYPALKVILVEREKPKMDFCRGLVTTLGLTNVSFEMKDVEQLPPESVLNAVCRDFAPLPKSLLIARKIVPKGGKFFHLKGDSWSGELASLPTQLFSFWAPTLVGQYRIPETGMQMSVVLTEKLAN